MNLDREKAREVLEPVVKFRWEWLVENGLLDRLAECVAPDPRLARIAVEGVVIEPEYQAAVHKLLWTALLPDTDLTLEERTEGEYFLARLAEKREASS